MKLYHGTNQDIETIDLSLCLPNKDFGRGTEGAIEHLTKTNIYKF